MNYEKQEDQICGLGVCLWSSVEQVRVRIFGILEKRILDIFEVVLKLDYINFIWKNIYDFLGQIRDLYKCGIWVDRKFFLVCLFMILLRKFILDFEVVL